MLMSESKQFSEWKLNLKGLDLGAVWDNIIAEIGGIDLTGDKNLDEIIVENESKEKLIKQIATLEKKAMSERQSRRKWELMQQIKQIKTELEELQ